MGISQHRRRFLKRSVAFAALVPTILTGCVPAAYAAWEVELPPNDSTTSEHKLALLDGVFLSMGYIKLGAAAGLLASYSLSSSGHLMLRIRSVPDRPRLLVILTESGEKSFSESGRHQVAIVGKALADTMAAGSVRQVEL